jgi:hypothetical protein
MAKTDRPLWLSDIVAARDRGGLSAVLSDIAKAVDLHGLGIVAPLWEIGADFTRLGGRAD